MNPTILTKKAVFSFFEIDEGEMIEPVEKTGWDANYGHKMRFIKS